jgi:hypothetical protein
MIHVFHFVTIKFLRVHFPFEDTPDIKNFFVCQPSNFDRKFDFIPTGLELFKSKDIFHHDFYDRSIIKKLHSLHRIDVVITANIFSDDIMINFLHSLGIKVFYIHHGLFTNVSGNIKKNIWAGASRYHGYDRYFCTPYERDYFLTAKFDPLKVICISGSPQLDYLMSLDLKQQRKLFLSHISNVTGNLENNIVSNGGSGGSGRGHIDFNKKIVLLVENNDGILQKHGAQDTMGEFKLMLETMIQLSEKYNFHIISKAKMGFIDPSLIKLHDHKNVTMIDGSKQGITLYHLLFSDLIFIQNSSTALLEGLLVNPCTVEFHLKFQNDNFGISEFGILKSQSIKDVESIVDKFINGTLITPELLNARQKFLQHIYGPEFNPHTVNSIYDQVKQIMNK